jgi:hypothetical protein
MICTMSKHAAEAKGCSDAMMFDYRGYVAEATGANIFFVRDGEVYTPDPDAFLNGITRQTVIGMLRDRQIKVHERHIMPEELEGFEQCWLTGTAAEVTPVGQIGDYNFEVGALTRDVSGVFGGFSRLAALGQMGEKPHALRDRHGVVDAHAIIGDHPVRQAMNVTERDRAGGAIDGRRVPKPTGDGGEGAEEIARIARHVPDHGPTARETGRQGLRSIDGPALGQI